MDEGWQASENSINTMGFAIGVFKALGWFVVAIGVLGAIGIAADSNTSLTGLERVLLAMSSVLLMGIYGLVLMVGGSVLDVFMGMNTRVRDIAENTDALRETGD
jgi:hypothetical protein